MRYHDKREKRVVIVDDSRTIQAMLDNLLESDKRFTVVGVASDARAAVKMVDDLRPDIVTIDLCMPYIDGAELLGMLADMKICKIVISDHAASSVAMMNRLCSAGASACLPKSVMASDPAGFLSTLTTIAAAFPASVNFKPSSSLRAVPSGPTGYAARGRSADFGYPIPADEQDRLVYLRRKQLANTMPERQFDLITRHFAQETGFPICLMTFIDRDTQWLKSSHGMAVGSVPRCEAFCNYTIAQDDVFVIRNAANDTAFATHPTVKGDPHIRTYVGHPIVTDEGIHAGALCVIDTKVRLVSDKLVAQLRGMAEIVAETLNRRPLLAA